MDDREKFLDGGHHGYVGNFNFSSAEHEEDKIGTLSTCQSLPDGTGVAAN